MLFHRKQSCLLLVAGMAALAICAASRGDNYPMLEQLNRETQSLYREVQTGLVRVQLPTPQWLKEAAAKDDPLKKWEKIVDPQVRQRIDEQRQSNAKEGLAKKIETVIVAPTTRPADGATTLLGGNWKVTQQAGGDEVVLESKSSTGSAIVIHSGGQVAREGRLEIGGPLQLKPVPAGSFAPNNIGLVLDDKGHVLIPLYIEKESFGDQPIRMMVGDTETTATFVGSDEKTNVTILKMTSRIGRPVRVSAERPMEGGMVMMLNPNNGSGRLQLWTGNERDFGVVVLTDGSIAGFVRYGQFLGGAACRPVIEQLIAQGQVKRKVLGVRLTEVRADDAARQKWPLLGERPALLVEDVSAASIAQKAGLRQGDLVLELEDQPVGDLASWSALSAKGGDVRLLLLRDGKHVNVRIDLSHE